MKGDHFKGCKHMHLNKLYTKSELKGMLEGKDYRALDMDFQFVVAFIDRATSTQESCLMTLAYPMYSKLLLGRNKQLEEEENWNRHFVDLTRHTDGFKKLLCEVFDALCDSGWYTLRFHLLDDLVEDLDRFGTLRPLHSSYFKRFNMHIKRVNRSTSKQHSSFMNETLREMGRLSTP